jgi:hypothetical protein
MSATPKKPVSFGNFSKDKISTAFGFFIMAFAVSCFYFDWPRLSDMWFNLVEFLFGLMLLFIDGESIAKKVFGRFTKEIEGEDQ